MALHVHGLEYERKDEFCHTSNSDWSKTVSA